jgi:hypothetical protein
MRVDGWAHEQQPRAALFLTRVSSSSGPPPVASDKRKQVDKAKR